MVTVNNGTELNTELTNATGGEIIEIAAGVNVGSITVNAKNYASEVIVRSLDTDNKGVFNYFRSQNGCNNLTISDVVFDYTYTSGDAGLEVSFSCSSCDNMKFDQIEFSGDFDGSGYATGLGFQLFYGNNIQITNCDLHDWNNVMTAFNPTNLTITGNQFRGQSSDALNITSCVTALIQGNHFHSPQTTPYPSAHMDFIQLLRNVGGCTDVDIYDNVFDHSNGHWTQTFWMGGDGYDLSVDANRHKRIHIRDNLVYNGHSHGIGAYGIDDLTVDHNTFLEGVSSVANYGPGPSPTFRLDQGSLTNCVISNNIYPGRMLGFTDWTGITDTNNYIVQRTDSGLTWLANGNPDGYHDAELVSGAAHTGLAGSRMMKRTGDWGGNEVTPPASYLGGGGGGATPPSTSCFRSPSGKPIMVNGKVYRMG